MLIPTKEWLPTSISGAMGSYVNWAGVPIDAEDMLDNLVAELAAQWGSGSHFNLATIYTMADDTAPALPVKSKSLSIAGTNSVGGPDKATQYTLNMRTAGIGHAKITMLDVPVGTSNFDKQRPAAFTAIINAIYASISSSAWAWS